MRTLAIIVCGILLVPGFGPGCANRGIPEADTSPRVEASDTPTPESDQATIADPAPSASSEPKPRKGTRVAGGFPPIRRPDLTSGLRIPGAQRFVLGGGQPSSFFCDVENQGQTTVMVYASRNGGYTVVARLQPGDSASHRFQPTESAIIANLAATDEARLRVRVWGDTNLGMEYEPNTD